MARKRKPGVKPGTKRGPYRKPVGIDIDKYLSPEGLANTATELKASIRTLNAKLKAVNALLRALKKEGK